MFRVLRVELEESVGQLLHQCRIEVTAHRPVVVEVGRRRREDPHLVGVDLLRLDQLVPHRGIEYAGLGLAGRNESDGSVMRTGEGDVLEVFLSGLRPACCRKKRGIRLPEVEDGAPKAKVLPLRSESDLIAGSAVMNFEVNLASSSRCTIGMAVPLVRIFACTKVKPPKPGEVELLRCQRLDHGRVVGDWRELDLLRPVSFFQVLAERRELALQFGRGLVRDGGDAQDGILCDDRTGEG